MRLMRFVPLCTTITLATVCLAQTQSARDEAKAGACGPDTDHFAAHRVHDAGKPGTPPAGKALVYVVETEDSQGRVCIKCSITAKVGLDGNWVGATYGDSFIAFPVEAGEHHLCTSWQSKLPPISKLTSLSGFTAEPGKVYYFRTHVAIPERRDTRALYS